MNKFWESIITLRNFSYHWTVKQYDEKWAASEYKIKVMGFISGYVTTLNFIVYQSLLYFFGTQKWPFFNETDPWWMRLLTGSVVFLLPVYLINGYLLKKVGHIPIPNTYGQREYRKNMWVFWAGFLLGWFLCIFVGMLLMSYLRGQEINMFNIHLNKGGHVRTFEEDFGW